MASRNAAWAAAAGMLLASVFLANSPTGAFLFPFLAAGGFYWFAGQHVGPTRFAGGLAAGAAALWGISTIAMIAVFRMDTRDLFIMAAQTSAFASTFFRYIAFGIVVSETIVWVRTRGRAPAASTT